MVSSAGSTGKFLKNNLLLLGVIIVLFFLNFYSKTIFLRPAIIHQWRQADCLSITKNYYEEGMHFFQPKIHFQGPKDGKAVSECPILNYTVAALWKVFGEHEFIYRLLEYLIFITAVFVLFNTLLRFYRSTVLSLFVVSILLTSPLLAYYSLNFLADVPALSFGIICFCLFFNFYQTKRPYLFYLALLTGTLAVLMKASALTGLSVLLFFTIVDLLRLNGFMGTQRLFEKRWLPSLVMLGSLLVIFLWYRFALHYNDNNTNNIFLLTVLPIWEMDEQQLIYNLKMLFNNLFPLFLNKPMFFLFMLLVVFVSSKFNELASFYRYAFLFSGLFFVFYLLFFFQVFGVHDYYLINLMIFPVITCMAFLSQILKTRFLTDNKGFVWAFVICLFIFNAFHSAAVYRLRTVEDDKLVYWFPFISEDEKRLAKYEFWSYGNNIKRLEEITPHLRKAGIKREDFVLSIPDQSFDISLYLMDQKGYTISPDHLEHDTTVMDRFIPRVKYIILSDTSLKRHTAFKRLSHHFEYFLTRGPVQVLRVKKGV